jgi:1-aminocyclopropane-1-carboxylate deaminase
MTDFAISTITTDAVSDPLFDERNITVAVLRLDKIHPVISGNKWFKLRYYLEEAAGQAKKKVVTYGGAWSNHLIATAAACKMNRLDSIGIVRGEEARHLSPTLLLARDWGMQLIFMNRADYRLKKIPDELNSNELYFINEGGYGIQGVAGAATIYDHFEKDDYTHICCAAGTGTMMTGMINGAPQTLQVVGISVLKNNRNLEKNVNQLLHDSAKRHYFIHDYAFGGYAKHSPELLTFMNEFYRQTTIPTDFVYTGKLFFAVTDLVKNNFFPGGSRLLVIHSGGLQGNASLDKGLLIF